MRFDQMTEKQRNKLLVAMYFIKKGAYQLDRLQDELSEKETREESKIAFEKKLKLFESIASVNDLYLYSDDETEDAKIEKVENEIYEWIEDKGFTEELRQFFSKNSIMFS